MDHSSKHLRVVSLQRPDPNEQADELRQVVDAEHAGDFDAYLNKRYPQLVATMQVRPTLEEFASAQGYAPDAEMALGLCQRCPPHGGLCDNKRINRGYTVPGMQPYWDEEELSLLTAQCARWPEHQLRLRLNKAGVPLVMQSARFNTFVPGVGSTEALEECMGYCEEFPTAQEFASGVKYADNLVLLGNNVGVGKTHLAIAVVAELLTTKKIPRARFVFVADLLEQIRASFNDGSGKSQALVTEACRSPVLVLDDLGAHRTTEWVIEQMLRIVNYRAGEGLPVIVTSNESSDGVATTFGQRVTDRIFGDAVIVRLTGDSSRWQTT